MISRDELALQYLEQLHHAPYSLQEEAILAWGECEQGVLLSAPTGTGKTLVAEAAIYEALKSGQVLYYSTPLIALTDQKLLEFQQTVARWGYGPESVGLVTGNRTVNPDAPIKVVVAEVLLNRLLHPEAFDFADVGSVVMDEFHNFNEPQRGIVWELALSLLPPKVRVMLLSATVGAANEFVNWMARSLGRRVVLVEGKERKVPLQYHWVNDELLPDHLEKMARGDDAAKRTPALVFCFDREVCWSTAEVLKGKDLLGDGQRDAVLKRLDDFDFTVGSGNKLRPLLARGVGIHHAGILPRYRRVVETLFVEKLLSVCVCTETLAAGLNLPARSVVLTTLVKGPRDKKKLIDPGGAQQMFGRAGRPQFDTQGHVYAMAHEDDVKLARWQEKFDSIPEDTKDPGLLAARKKLAKKKPTRRPNFVYWNAEQFVKLQAAPAARLASRGHLPWRWLGHLLATSPSVELIHEVIRHRLMDPKSIEQELKRVDKMLVTLHRMGYVVCDPEPPLAPDPTAAGDAPGIDARVAADVDTSRGDEDESDADQPPTARPGEAVHASGGSAASTPKPAGASTDGSTGPSASAAADPSAGKPAAGRAGGSAGGSTPRASAEPSKDLVQLLRLLKLGDGVKLSGATAKIAAAAGIDAPGVPPATPKDYEPITATPTDKLSNLLVFRGVHPLYGVFLMDYLGLADDAELLQILESLLEMPGSAARSVRVPWPDELPPGRLATEVLDPAILSSGLATQEDLYPQADQSDLPPELRKYPVPLAEKMRMVFESKADPAGGYRITPVWAAGDLLNYAADFDKFIRSRDLIKQEGILFKHFLRLVLLCEEFAQLTPAHTDPAQWRARLKLLTDQLTAACRAADPQSTDQMLEELDMG